jgi:hypothetical protein
MYLSPAYICLDFICKDNIFFEIYFFELPLYDFKERSDLLIFNGHNRVVVAPYGSDQAVLSKGVGPEKGG